jgi:hypothetical protein
LNYFPDKAENVGGEIKYQITTTPGQKQNASDFATLAQTVLKVQPSAEMHILGLQPPQPPEVWYAAGAVKATSPLPYNLAITVTIGASKDQGGNQTQISQKKTPKGSKDKHDDAKAQANDASKVTAPDTSQAQVVCNPSPCSFSKTVTHYDPEYWDVSLGVSVPGVLEPKYKTATANGITTYSLGSATRHTDAYAFLDIYAFQYFAGAPASLSKIPHFNLGIPITSQSLHRPYVGVAENLSFLTKLVKLGFPLSGFVGPVFLKQQVYSPAISGLTWDHATKLMYGVELPISSITKYMKGGGSSTGSKTSTASN